MGADDPVPIPTIFLSQLTSSIKVPFSTHYNHNDNYSLAMPELKVAKKFKHAPNISWADTMGMIETNGFTCKERDISPKKYMRGTHWIFSNYIEVR